MNSGCPIAIFSEWDVDEFGWYDEWINFEFRELKLLRNNEAKHRSMFKFLDFIKRAEKNKLTGKVLRC